VGAGSTRTLNLHGAEDHCGASAAAMVRRALDELAGGEQLQVLTDVADHAFMVRALAARSGRAIVTDEVRGGERRLVIR